MEALEQLFPRYERISPFVQHPDGYFIINGEVIPSEVFMDKHPDFPALTEGMIGRALVEMGGTDKGGGYKIVEAESANATVSRMVDNGSGELVRVVEPLKQLQLVFGKPELGDKVWAFVTHDGTSEIRDTSVHPSYILSIIGLSINDAYVNHREFWYPMAFPKAGESPDEHAVRSQRVLDEYEEDIDLLNILSNTSFTREQRSPASKPDVRTRTSHRQTGNSFAIGNVLVRDEAGIFLKAGKNKNPLEWDTYTVVDVDDKGVFSVEVSGIWDAFKVKKEHIRTITVIPAKTRD